MSTSSNKVEFITISDASENNLKKVSVKVPKEKFVVFSGVSGSGKSSLAIDVLNAEGKRLYLGLSTYARQFEEQAKPKLGNIHGMGAPIAIDQKGFSRNPRSTVATITDIYDFLRVLFASVGEPHSPVTGKIIKRQAATEVVEKILSLPPDSNITFYALIAKNQKGDFRKELALLKKNGYRKFTIDNVQYDVDHLPILESNVSHTIKAVIGNLFLSELSLSGKNKTAYHGLKEQIFSFVNTATRLSKGILELHIVSVDQQQQEMILSQGFSCPVSGFTIEEPNPKMFSFNVPQGTCPECDGLGKESFFSRELVVPQPRLSLVEGAIHPWSAESKIVPESFRKKCVQVFRALSEKYSFDPTTQFCKLPEKIQNIIFDGSNGELLRIQYSDGARYTVIEEEFEGVIQFLEKRADATTNTHLADELTKYRDVRNCRCCNGYRLNNKALHVKVAGIHIGELCQMSITDAIQWFRELDGKLDEKKKQIANQLIEEVIKRLMLLEEIGVGYLSLDRQAQTLSGGEGQRVKITRQVGSSLSGIVYVLDEPCAGAHEHDKHRIIDIICSLTKMGNSLLVVEHDLNIIRRADYVIDVGPGAGKSGGYIVATGTPEEIGECPESITGLYLSGRRNIGCPSVRRTLNTDMLSIYGATAYNIKDVNIDVPCGVLTAITGVSGSGKSTFVELFYKAVNNKINGMLTNSSLYKKITGVENVDKIIRIDQSPIGRTPRSNPATYINVFTQIRELYANLPDSISNGYTAARFSFNIKGGRCEVCEGDGVIKVEMYFLPDVYIQCDACGGKRYNQDTLQIKWNGYSIADILELSIDEAMEAFTDVPAIREKISLLQEVGLGYMQMGQSATTLSGGEAQRVKLSRELSKRAHIGVIGNDRGGVEEFSKSHTVYLLDEPSKGLHPEDVTKLISTINRLVDRGDTVIVVEHNMSIVAQADYVIDFGPGGGPKGGKVLCVGRPEDICQHPDSLTGIYLKEYLSRLSS
ncbi:excinuclease ABC subunit UvrA [Candidatus Fokinia crypta]|uniref:UvrABC system protein A n=1 Tax=Candidatus Fokinia crypta TaxID=1920990 RepID=A0ABZ0US75_9RICK|nr:excinuclease ABC subunit UvrA [Candidatus Fokinia cryptica]WPX97543.1 UvrABC system protein A [Candidatus Fokinia cryptica]